MTEERKTPREDVSPTDPVDQERRDVLERLGKFAAYTPPVMLALYTSKDAVASGPSDGGP